MFDVNSTLGRKNPLGAVKAFKQAFSAKNQNVGLVIKVNNADEAKLAKLKKELEDYNNVYMITEVMEKKRTNRLIECVDVFVSLHRAEGFGLVMAEAMMLGTPVIATNWSANVELRFPMQNISFIFFYYFDTVVVRTTIHYYQSYWDMLHIFNYTFQRLL